MDSNEPRTHRSGKCQINTFYDKDDIYTRLELNVNAPPYLPPAQNSELLNIEKGEVVARRKTRYGYYTDDGMLGTTSLAGVGSEEKTEYPDDENLVREIIKSKYDIIGISGVENNNAWDARDQGFTTDVSGLASVDILYPNMEYFPGQFVAADLPRPLDTHNNSYYNNRPIGKYTWKVVPENHETAGDAFVNHFRGIMDNPEKWKKVMNYTQSMDATRWLSAFKAFTDSQMMTGLLFLNTLMDLDIVQINPNLKDSNHQMKLPDCCMHTHPDALTPVVDEGLREAAEKAHDTSSSSADGKEKNRKAGNQQFILRLAELFKLQEEDDIPISSMSRDYFELVTKVLLETINYDGRTENFEFGNNQGRDDYNCVNLGCPEGKFVHNQINHHKKAISAFLHTVDDVLRFRLGMVTSEPGRQERINVVLGRPTV